jgi:hypothetical protein
MFGYKDIEASIFCVLNQLHHARAVQNEGARDTSIAAGSFVRISLFPDVLSIVMVLIFN